VLCRRNGYHEADDWPVSELLDRVIAIQAVDAERDLFVVMSLFALFEEKQLQAGLKEMHRISLGALGEK
jgi:hypothetical protein